MKLGWFVLGFIAGTASTYAVLTRVVWPGQRGAEVGTVPQVVASASPPPVTLPPTPEAVPSTPFPEASLSPPPSPWTADSAPVPAPAGPPVWPSFAAPAETKAVDLPLLKTDLDRLRERVLLLPVRGVEPRSLQDSFGDGRSNGRDHKAIDILAPRGTPVLAVDDGRVEKLFTSKLGGLTIYQFDHHGEYCYYYAHLDRYAPGLEPGMAVRKGDVIGFVGTTGNAPPGTPHLHFTIFRLGPEKRWWEGTAINAYPLWGKPASP